MFSIEDVTALLDRFLKSNTETYTCIDLEASTEKVV